MMNPKSCLRTAFLISCALAPSLFAAESKIEFPDASQHATLTQRVGLTDVSIEYSRPDKRGRDIFGALVPYGQVWRTGANQPTKIKFSDAVKISGQDLPAGEYALYTIPGENDWTNLISRHTKLRGAQDYTPQSQSRPGPAGPPPRAARRGFGRHPPATGAAPMNWGGTFFRASSTVRVFRCWWAVPWWHSRWPSA